MLVKRNLLTFQTGYAGQKAELDIYHRGTEGCNFRLLIADCRLRNFLRSDLFKSTFLNLKSPVVVSVVSKSIISILWYRDVSDAIFSSALPRGELLGVFF